jgi:nucleoside-diphosphate-sugar epimerase
MSQQAKIYVAGHRGMVGSAILKHLQSNVIASEARQSIPLTFSVVSNPEFLKEGAAVEDFTRPDRIVLGVDDTPAGLQALATMRQLYAPFNRNHERTRVMDVKSAEFTKYAANAMLATRISFMNELANLAEQVGVDIELVRQFIEWTAAELGMQLRWEGSGVDEVAYAVIASEARQSMPFCPTDIPIIRIDPRYFRPTEVETLLGDPSKAKQKLGWVPEITAQEMCAEMVAHDLAQTKQYALLKANGYSVNVSVE